MSPPKFKIFLIFPYFLRSCLKFFADSYSNLDTTFALLDITFRFTRGSADLYYNTVKFQNIMTMNVGCTFIITFRYIWRNLSLQLNL